MHKNVRPRSIARAVVILAFTTLAGLLAASAASARERPTCFGKTATIVGTKHRDVIIGTAGKDVIVAKGGNDVIKANKKGANHGKDIICGSGGNDKISGNDEKNVIIGGAGNDKINAGPGNDLVVGDNAARSGDESGRTGKDYLGGAGGRDWFAAGVPTITCPCGPRMHYVRR